MKRERPDPLHFAIWVARHLTFDGRWECARHLWNHWSDYADEIGARRGTPRSFSNALRRLGAPWRRGLEIRELAVWQPRSRVHRNVRLCLPSIGRDVPLEDAIARVERYGQ